MVIKNKIIWSNFLNQGVHWGLLPIRNCPFFLSPIFLFFGHCLKNIFGSIGYWNMKSMIERKGLLYFFWVCVIAAFDLGMGGGQKKINFHLQRVIYIVWNCRPRRQKVNDAWQSTATPFFIRKISDFKVLGERSAKWSYTTRRTSPVENF